MSEQDAEMSGQDAEMSGQDKAAPAETAPLDWKARALGCLQGGALGDTLGAAVEFMDRASILRRHGRAGLTRPEPTSEGRLLVTDDTQMTLFTFEGLLLAGEAIEAGTESAHPRPPAGATGPLIAAVNRAYLDWYETQSPKEDDPGAGDESGRLKAEPVLCHHRAPGNTCLSALAKGGGGDLTQRINGSKGCGGLMRVAPVGLIRGWSPAECFDIGCRTAALTHGHPSGWYSAGAFAALIRVLLDGVPMVEAARVARGLLLTRESNETAETLTSLDRALALAASPSAEPWVDIAALGEGWVAEESLAIALYASLVSETAVQSLILAANHDGDSDSTAALAGQLWGTYGGPGLFPDNWRQALDIGFLLPPLLARAQALGWDREPQ